VAWIILAVAGVFESAWALGMKQSDGFTRPLSTTLTILAIIASMGLLALALKSLPVGPAYAVWVSIGVLGTLIGSVLWFDESLGPWQVVFAAFVGIGVVGLAWSSNAH
jgi:quaternary ammonium compound-resistance protein SugE